VCVSVLRIRGLRNSLGCFSHVKNIDLHYITVLTATFQKAQNLFGLKR